MDASEPHEQSDTWGGLCVFDHEVYIRQIVPAFRAGEHHPIIQRATVLRVQAMRQPCAFRGLAQVVATCDESMTTCGLGRDFHVHGGVIAAAGGPPVAGDTWSYADFADLFEWVVARQAITHYTVLGLDRTGVQQLYPAALGLDTATTELMRDLAERGRYWAHGGDGEGIHGWLDAAETRRLAGGLPAVPPTGAANQGSELLQRLFRHTLISTSAEQAPATFRAHYAQLLQFQALVRVATSAGRGLLWGCDLRLFFQYHQLFAAGEPRPQEL